MYKYSDCRSFFFYTVIKEQDDSQKAILVVLVRLPFNNTVTAEFKAAAAAAHVLVTVTFAWSSSSLSINRSSPGSSKRFSGALSATLAFELGLSWDPIGSMSSLRGIQLALRALRSAESS